jgi:hypothetical protein
VQDPLVIALEYAHHVRSPEINEDLGFVVEHLPGASRVAADRPGRPAVAAAALPE